MSDEPEWMRKQKEEKFNAEVAHWLLLVTVLLMALVLAIVSDAALDVFAKPVVNSTQGE